MATPQRRSSITKAPDIDPVVALTSEPTPVPATQGPPALVEHEPQAPAETAAAEPVVGSIREESDVIEIRRPGPGRPRKKRRMEQFSSKIEIDLRDQVDIYLANNEETLVDFLDDAIRAKLKRAK